ASAYLWRARVLAREGQLPKAVADYETYTTLFPDSAKAYQELEALYGQTGQTEKVATVHAKSVALKAEKGEVSRESSLLDQLWMTRLREGLGQVVLGPVSVSEIPPAVAGRRGDS